MRALDEIKFHFQALSARDQKLAIATAVLLLCTLFYVGVWEPLHQDLERQQQRKQSQQEIYLWMQDAANQVKTLRASSGGKSKIVKRSSPVSILTEQSARTANMKKYISKIESSGKNTTQVKLDDASFDQMLLWINTLKTRYGILIASAHIERSEKSGLVDARITFNRPS